MLCNMAKLVIFLVVVLAKPAPAPAALFSGAMPDPAPAVGAIVEISSMPVRVTVLRAGMFRVQAGSGRRGRLCTRRHGARQVHAAPLRPQDHLQEGPDREE